MSVLEMAGLEGAMNNVAGESAWRWLCRGLAVVGFVFLLATVGFNAPWGAFLLLLGLFFGPEVVAGQIQINRRSDDPPK